MGRDYVAFLFNYKVLYMPVGGECIVRVRLSISKTHLTFTTYDSIQIQYRTNECRFDTLHLNRRLNDKIDSLEYVL